MSPLLVVRTLAGSPLANLGVVRQYLINVYHTEEQQIQEHSSVINQYRYKFNLALGLAVLGHAVVALQLGLAV
jgi:hypothetical protein